MKFRRPDKATAITFYGEGKVFQKPVKSQETLENPEALEQFKNQTDLVKRGDEKELGMALSFPDFLFVKLHLNLSKRMA